jgi:hypothetical protein
MALFTEIIPTFAYISFVIILASTLFTSKYRKLMFRKRKP